MGNALEYFAQSQFYDRTCNNEVVKMQTKFNNLDEMHMQMRFVRVWCACVCALHARMHGLDRALLTLELTYMRVSRIHARTYTYTHNPTPLYSTKTAVK